MDQAAKGKYRQAVGQEEASGSSSSSSSSSSGSSSGSSVDADIRAQHEPDGTGAAAATGNVAAVNVDAPDPSEGKNDEPEVVVEECELSQVAATPETAGEGGSEGGDEGVGGVEQVIEESREMAEGSQRQFH